MFIYIYGIFLVSWEVICCKIFMETFAAKQRRYRNTLRYLFFLALIIVDYVIAVAFNNNLIVKQSLVVLAYFPVYRVR